MEDWPALHKWTFEFLKSAYGEDTVTPVAGLGSASFKVTKLWQYIEYLDAPSEKCHGFWIDASSRIPLLTAPQEAMSAPLYLLSWRAFQIHPELYEDIEPAPEFIEDWILSLTPALRDAFEWTCNREYWALYVGPEGALSRLHVDFWGTHSYLAQIQGKKRCILFSPDDSKFLYEGDVDPEYPDLKRFKLLERATAYEGTIVPGDMLFTPSGWWHQVRALEKSITVSHNFFNQVNFAEHVASITRHLPAFVSGFEKAAAVRKALRIKWRCRGFDNDAC
jgi:histone arginine demethylase JMJD6